MKRNTHTAQTGGTANRHKYFLLTQEIPQGALLFHIVVLEPIDIKYHDGGHVCLFP